MTTLEDRLRTELPQLADFLAATEDGFGERASSVESSLPHPRPGRRWSLLVGAAAALVAAIVLAVVLNDTDEATIVATGPDPEATTQSTFGTWSVLAEAPIDPRAYAVTAWTGDEAVFWAGSSLDQRFAHTDGAAYAPESDTWRTISVPGWGHPGLTSAFLDGQLFALAKGGGSRLDPGSGVWADLPPADEMALAAIVAADDAIWALGPASSNLGGQPSIAIARYEPDADTWDYGPVFEAGDQQAWIVQDLAQLESSVHWDGGEIIVWGGVDGGVAFDPAKETWRVVNPPEPPSGSANDSVAAVTDAGLTVLVDIDTPEGLGSSVAILEAGGWRWLDAAIPIQNFESVTTAALPDWLVVFSTDGVPITIHMPSGGWSAHAFSPLGAVEAPNTVWTGDQLLIWGGVTSDPTSPEGVSWTPPRR